MCAGFQISTDSNTDHWYSKPDLQDSNETGKGNKQSSCALELLWNQRIVAQGYLRWNVELVACLLGTGLFAHLLRI